jgi:hypothetical protein
MRGFPLTINLLWAERLFSTSCLPTADAML